MTNHSTTNLLSWDHWHIEISSICALRCPRCPRAEVPDSLLNRQLDLKFFQQQIEAIGVQNMKKVTFCGNDGDPIYCRDLISIVTWMKNINPNLGVTLVTNGSHRSVEWWQDLAQVLDHQDEIHWSLDGWDQHSNEQYRVHSDWSSIMQGICTFATNNRETYRIWASIAFRFNENYLDQQQSMARDLGFDLYQLTKSTKFGSKYPLQYGRHDHLEPSQTSLISTGHRFERQTIAFTQRPRPGRALKDVFWQRAQDLDKHTQYAGLCLIGNKGIFLNSQGHVYPCCWTANRYPHNQIWHDMAFDRFNLRERSLTEIQQDEFWSTDFLKFNSIECSTKCTRDRLRDPEHTTEW